jgi:hypothetical protein
VAYRGGWQWPRRLGPASPLERGSGPELISASRAPSTHVSTSPAESDHADLFAMTNSACGSNPLVPLTSLSPP